MILGDVWIVGDSLIRRSPTRLVDWPQVRWNGLGGAQYGDVCGMRQRIELFMRECTQFFPEARLVWSDILPRACYLEIDMEMEMKRRAVNRWAWTISRRLGTAVLHHPQFQ